MNTLSFRFDLARKWLVFASCIFVIQVSNAQEIYFVDSSAQGLNNGSSWQNAYTSLDSIQAIFKSLTIYDTVKVAKGTYKPSSALPGASDPRDISFNAQGITYLGGYPSGGGMRDWIINQTILSGDIGIPGDFSDNAYHVINAEQGGVFDGFTIENGNANGSSYPQNGGGGAFCGSEQNLRFVNCIFQKNYAINGGAIGFWAPYNFLGIEQCVFQFNNADFGGAIYSPGGFFFLSRSVLINNTASYNGGGVWIGGGFGFVVSELYNSLFIANEASNGGGIFAARSRLTFSNLTFYQNKVLLKGGGFYNGSNILVECANSIFSENESKGVDGDIYDSLKQLDSRSLIVQNYKGGKGSLQAENIYFQNKDNLLGDDGTWGTKDDGLRITPASPAFNSGYNGLTGLQPLDLTGVSRILNVTVDIGAYEIDPGENLASRTAYVDVGASGKGTGGSWIDAFNDLESALNLKRAGCIDTIKMASGKYTPHSYPVLDEFKVLSERFKTFVLPDSAKIIGGYPTGGGKPDAALNPTILSGAYDLSQVIIAANVKDIYLENLKIEKGLGIKDTLKIRSKVVITGNGAGLHAIGSEVKIKNCLFTLNSCNLSGGGMYAIDSKVTLVGTTIKENFSYGGSSYGGGGLYFSNLRDGSSLTRCTIDSNAAGAGGGIYINQTVNLLFDSCSFSGNLLAPRNWRGTLLGGGALYNLYSQSTILRNCLFKANDAEVGGAVFSYSSTKLGIDRCVFTSNTSKQHAAGLFLGGSYGVYNSIFYRNNTPDTVFGGAAIMCTGIGNIQNCTFFENSSNGMTGAVYAQGTTINNSIFWRNRIKGDVTKPGADVNDRTGAYNLLQTYKQSKCIVNIDPMFKDTAHPAGLDGIWGTADDGLIPLIKSPAINNGRAIFIAEGISKDILGNERVQGINPELGAYEIDFCKLSGFTSRIAYVDSAKKGGSQTGSSWLNAFSDLEEALDAVRCHCADTIYLAKGTYHPTADTAASKYYTDSASEVKTFNLPSGTSLLGGFSSGGGVRNSIQNLSILDGRQRHRVLLLNNVKNGLIDGVTITNGFNIEYRYPNLTLNGNGGGITVLNSSFQLKNAVVKNNLAWGWGGGIYIYNSTGSIQRCVFDSNVSHGGAGGALYDILSSVNYMNCIFSGNFSDQGGGAAGLGGEMSTYTTNLKLGTNANFLNCVFKGNSSFYSCGIEYRYCSPVITNSIFLNYSPPPLWDSTKLTVYNLRETRPAILTNCIIQYPVAGATNSIVRQYPKFKDSANLVGPDGLWFTDDDGLQLTEGSPAFNKGSTDSVAMLPTDILGHNRVQYGLVDIGAYEFGSSNGSSICEGGTIFFIGGNIADGISSKWQMNSGSGYSYISDGINYSGAYTDTLAIVSAPTEWYGYKYRVEYNVEGQKYYSQEFVLKFENVWVGGENENWANPSNWSCGVVPDENTDVVINAGSIYTPVIKSSVTIHSLTVNDGVNVKVNPGVIVTINK